MRKRFGGWEEREAEMCFGDEEMKSGGGVIRRTGIMGICAEGASEMQHQETVRLERDRMRKQFIEEVKAMAADVELWPGTLVRR